MLTDRVDRRWLSSVEASADGGRRQWRHVMETRTAHLDLADDPSSPRVARRFLATVLTGWGISADLVESSQLLASELVSNAVLHGRGGARLVITEVDSERGIIRVEVCNDGDGEPAMRRANRDELSGRGLRLIDELSSGWGSRTADGQTTVWFELRAFVA